MEKSRVELYELVWAKPMTHLESFRVLASDQAESSEQYWGLEFMDEEQDPDFEETFNDERSLW